MDPIAATSVPAKEERTWAMATHLSALIGYLGVPFGNILGPLVMWIIKKDSSAFINDQGKEAINAQISYTIYLAIAGLLCFVLVGFVLFPIVYVAALAFMIIASLKANEGVSYRYPGTLRFLK